MSILEKLRSEYDKRNPGGYWFYPRTMEEFNTKIDENNYFQKDQNVYFISSERYENEDYFTIRKMDKKGKITNQSKYLEFKTIQEAEKTFKGLIG